MSYAEWLPVAQALKDMCIRHNLSADNGVTADAARVSESLAHITTSVAHKNLSCSLVRVSFVTWSLMSFLDS